MSKTGDVVDGVRGVTPAEGTRLEAVGRIKDLSRDDIVVHVGKPAGSVTGYVGPLFFQVHVDPRDAAGTVRARIEQGEVELYQYDAALPKDQILDQAKDRIILEAQAVRAARLESLKTNLDALADA